MTLIFGQAVGRHIAISTVALITNECHALARPTRFNHAQRDGISGVCTFCLEASFKRRFLFRAEFTAANSVNKRHRAAIVDCHGSIDRFVGS